jgi:uncharacterized alpha-E superfamily protein
MLARVVETIYWMARYLERAEDMARLINVNANLIMDMPKGTTLGWEPILDITASREAYLENHDSFDERPVLRYLIAEKQSPISLISNLEAAKENARTIRDTIPRECWEEINTLFMFARDNLNMGLSKRGRHQFLTEIITTNQTISGLLAGTMNHDEGYLFLKMGRNIERADMTTRFIDVRTQSLFEDDDLLLKAFENIQWMSVLKSLTGYQMYRREMQVSIRHSKVLWFLIMSRIFPRSVFSCANEVAQCIEKLPNNKAALAVVTELRAFLEDADLSNLNHNRLHKFIDHIQVRMGELHAALSSTYFLSGVIAAEQAQKQRA